MAKQPAKSSQKKDTRPRNVGDLPPKALKGRKAASVRGGAKAGTKEPYLVIKMDNVLISG
jgi:hypothetical protein